MKSVDKYLKAADEAIKTVGIANKLTAANSKTSANELVEDAGTAQKWIIKKAYKGAVSAFGASIIMSGLIPTIQFYLEASDNRDSDTKKIVEAIAKIIFSKPEQQNAAHLRKEMMLLQERPHELDELKRKITDAAIALKIMMRSYQFTKETAV